MPFTTTQFFDVFSAYNEAIWPAHIVAYMLGAIAVTAMLSRRAAGYSVALGILGLLWLWNGAAYHLTFFSRVNDLAYGFGALFIAQGLLFLGLATRPSSRRALKGQVPRRTAGAVLIVYAALGYSFIGWLEGHAWPKAPMFGVAPCPTVIFTLGLLMLSPRSVPGWLFIGPLLWAAIGSSAAVLLSVLEDLGLLVSGVIVVGWSLVKAQPSNASLE